MDQHEHEEQEHEVYGSEIPDEREMDADIDMSSRPEEEEEEVEEEYDEQNPNSKDLEDMKKRLKEIEEEAGALREMQAKVEKEMGAVQDSSSGSATQAEKEEVDSRSVYVGNVDYACTPEEVQQHFQSCGTVNRVTILTDKFGQPKGFAYVEFVEVDAVQNALLLNESELHGRQLKVSAKRTNIPGMKQYRGRRPNPYSGFRSRRPFMPAPFSPPYGPKSIYKDPDDGKQRFLLELEFVQCLANPTYIHYLAQNRYFEDEAFIGYLKYLQYWQQPEYIKFIMYPHCLFFLELLQNASFRNAMAHPGNKELTHRQQFFFWKNYRNNRLKHILPRPLPEPVPTPPTSALPLPPLQSSPVPPTTVAMPAASASALSPMPYGMPPGSTLAKNDMRNTGIDRRKRKKEV
ncbi:polyadenylate-binding protein 1 isoform X2 [Ricinus communis]|uniref:polyadenylate-binding protein 1 isoform X2 n=1 Tax=Ricinus communis TaxID=3988 RepID=UPI00201A23E0|nr:polyadenylate-binding protein 1 isoform X2 [Ricinus communis]